MFTPTIDADAWRANSRAALPLEVKMDVAFALGCACITSIASSRLLTGEIDATGPKISSWPIVIEGETSSKTVGPEEEPFSLPATESSRPSTTSRAPSCTPFVDVAEDALPVPRR